MKRILLGIFAFVLTVILAACGTAPGGSTPEVTQAIQPTQTPSVTDTPSPTATPILPTATMDADPTVYDNFNNPANDGHFNEGLWQDTSSGIPVHEFVQDKGLLRVSRSGAAGSAVLTATSHKDFALDKPLFIEAKLMLDAKEHAGNISIELDANVAPGQTWFSQCVVYPMSDAFGAGKCWDTIWPQQQGHEYVAGIYNFKHGTWHLYRIEIDPKTMTFTYFIDQRKVGTHVPKDADQIRNAPFTFNLTSWAPVIDPGTGYIDDVRIGTLTK